VCVFPAAKDIFLCPKQAVKIMVKVRVSGVSRIRDRNGYGLGLRSVVDSDVSKSIFTRPRLPSSGLEAP